MIIAPILNTFSKIPEKTQRYVMVAFFLFEAIYWWALGGRRFFVNGYGPLHFIGLYITAQYIHNQLNCSEKLFIKRLFQMPKVVDLGVFFVTAMLNTVFIVILSMHYGRVSTFHLLIFAYSNPLIIIGALYLLLFFTKIKMRNIKIINWLGASSFAVYLLHGEGNVRHKLFIPQIQYLYESFYGVECLCLLFLYLCVVYLVAVLIDQFRIYTWNRLCKSVDIFNLIK